MPTPLDRGRVSQCLEAFDLTKQVQPIFADEAAEIVVVTVYTYFF